MAQGPSKKILIIDDNPRLLKLLELRFSQAGFQTYTVDKVKDAVITAILAKPDIIISDVLMPEIDGLEFKKLLGNIPIVADVPFIFLTSGDKIPHEFFGQEFGPIDYLRKPYTFEDLLSKVEASLRRYHQRIDTLSEDSKVSSGTLGDMTLIDVIQVMAMNKKSCTLKLSRGDTIGKIFLQDGRIVDADAGDIKGEEAIYQLLRWKGADFSVGDLSEFNGEETITKDIHSIISEGLKRTDKGSEGEEAVTAEEISVDQTGTEEDEREFLYRLKDRGILKGV